ncbi:unnamed protein product [Brassicogethes aeneus]|uniref:TTF-type domain-containing protein n=1 Tax=Brassicogethes aeneus TaxID=1431903 RepID=A0A9P0B202_BRAAE|nr:unnamed protein product [Brassicogethes aeneus]
MSSGSKKKLSGAQFKKRRLEMVAEREKLSGSMNKFLKSNSSTPQPSLSNVELDRETLVDDNQQRDSSIPVCNDREVTPLFITDNMNVDIADPATWPNLLSNNLVELIVTKGAVQIIEDFPVDETGRKFSSVKYTRKLPNGEKVHRDWLVYSKTTNAVFCIFCKLFSSLSHQLISGYSDWRHLSTTISRHDNSMEHVKCAQKWYELKLRLDKGCTIDKEHQKQYEIEKKRWRAIIKRMIYIVQYLAGQNLAFRGDSQSLYELNNGKFLKLVEMVAKFDPIIMEHLNNIQNSKNLNQHMPHYLDETPDASHIEQLTFIVRFVHCTPGAVEIREHF